MRAAIVLAAGASRRYGRNKLLESVAGVPLVRLVITAVQESTVRDVIVVLGHEAERVREVLADASVRFVVNDAFEGGMGGSVATGASALPADCQRVAVVLGDQPVEPDIIDELFRTAEKEGKPITAPVYDGVRRHPVVFDASMFDELAHLSGHAGVRVLLNADPDRVTLLKLQRPVPVDLDHPGDLGPLERSVRARRLAQ